MEKNKKIILGIVIVIIAISAVAGILITFADPYENVINKDSVKGMIDEYDTNNDEKLSSLELSVSAYNAGMNTSIAYKTVYLYDSDGDGKLNPQELDKFVSENS